MTFNISGINNTDLSLYVLNWCPSWFVMVFMFLSVLIPGGFDAASFVTNNPHLPKLMILTLISNSVMQISLPSS